MSVTFDRDYNEFEITCDLCGNSEGYHHCNSFADGIKMAKSQDWRVFKNGDEWEHHCPMCSMTGGR